MLHGIKAKEFMLIQLQVISQTLPGATPASRPAVMK